MSAQKIDSNKLETYKIIITWFQVNDKDWKFYFFEKTFLLADISMPVSFSTLLVIFSDIEVNFND